MRRAGLRLAAADHFGSAAMPELTAAQRQKLEKARELVGKAAQRDAKVADRDLYDRLLKQARAGGPAAGSKCPRPQQPVRPQYLQRPAARLGGEPLPFGCKSSRGEPAAVAPVPARPHPFDRPGPDGCLYSECQPSALSMHKRPQFELVPGGFTQMPLALKQAASEQLEYHMFMGLFPQIHRAWMTIDHMLFLWDYTDPRGSFYQYDGLDP